MPVPKGRREGVYFIDYDNSYLNDLDWEFLLIYLDKWREMDSKYNWGMKLWFHHLSLKTDFVEVPTGNKGRVKKQGC